jgi:hypothetical protein
VVFFLWSALTSVHNGCGWAFVILAQDKLCFRDPLRSAAM